MRITLRSSLHEYEVETIPYSRSTDFLCPNCRCNDFLVWFTNVRQIDLTCNHCGNFIHITGVIEDKNHD